jgi:hypothetical protein
MRITPELPILGLGRWRYLAVLELLPADLIYSRFIHTKILSDPVADHLKNQGIKFATVEDAGQCLMRIASDVSINGMWAFHLPKMRSTAITNTI